MTDSVCKVERTFQVSQDVLYNAWLNPETLCKFMIPGEGMHCPRASNTPEVGGRFDLVMAHGDDEIPHGGEYRVLEPYSKIVFTWESPFSTEGSTVTLEFTKKEGGTHLVLTHVKFPNEESRQNHEAGWSLILAKLEQIAG